MKLYKIETKNLGEHWVIAQHPTEAEQKLTEALNKSYHGFMYQRRASVITVIAEAIVEGEAATYKHLVL